MRFTGRIHACPPNRRERLPSAHAAYMTSTGNTSLKVCIYLECMQCPDMVSRFGPASRDWPSSRTLNLLSGVVGQPSSPALPGGIWKMRKSLWAILAVLWGAIGAPNAYADSFTAIFTCSPGPCVSTPTATALFVPGTLTIENFTVFATTFPPFSSSIPQPTDTFTWLAYSTDPSNPLLTPLVGFLFTDLTKGGAGLGTNDLVDFLSCGRHPTNCTLEGGALTFVPVAAPELSSVGLMLTGIGLLLVMRKRIAQGLHQATGTPLSQSHPAHH